MFNNKLLIVAGIIILLLAGVLIQRFLLQKESANYVPASVDSEGCITENIGGIKPDQELCQDHPDLKPVKTYYADGWKVVCCKENND